MSDLEGSFLQAIARQPHDWLPRLIFADWLEERGDPRADLIRLSHQLTRLDCEDRPQKEARLHELSADGVVWHSPSLANSLNLPLVLIPPGQFRMGSPESEPEHQENETQVEVTLTQGFWLGQYEVTQGEYEAVTARNPGRFNREYLQMDSSRHPVERLSWMEAMEFCRLLTAREQAAGRLPSDWSYTLPTEAQWEYACRAGTTTATAFGDQLDGTRANFDGRFPYNGAETGEDKRQSVAVGSYEANAWNLYDMHGNVWEWCLDWYAGRLSGGTDPCVREEPEDRLRLTRGGGWSGDGVNCRSSLRNYVPANFEYCSYDTGFRIAVVQSR